MPLCPTCGGDRVVKNGHIHTAKQRHLCQRCRRQFVENLEHGPVSAAIKALINRLLRERLSLAAVCRAVGVSERWLQT